MTSDTDLAQQESGNFLFSFFFLFFEERFLIQNYKSHGNDGKCSFTLSILFS